VVLAMADGLVATAFEPELWRRLTAVCHVPDRAPLTTFDGPRAGGLLARCDVLLAHWGCPVIDERVLAAAPRLRLVAYAGGSVRAVASPALWASGVTVTSAAPANARPVAEYALAAILFANKGAFLAREAFRARRCAMPRWRGGGNRGRRVGVVGASHTGRALIGLLHPFDLDVVVADPYLSDADAGELGVRRVGLDELLVTSDVVTLHVPELPSTRHLIDRRALGLMRTGAVLVNTSRGSIVDEPALLEELRSGRLSAVLDVTAAEPSPDDSALYELPNVFLTPHLAGATGAELPRLTGLAIAEIERWARGLDPCHPVTGEDLVRIA
jgi:phosphoglycerate dehydrogenase-like enzyme